MKIKHLPFAFMLALAAPTAQSAIPQQFPAKEPSAAKAKPAPSAEFLRAEALRKQKIQLDAALAKHNAKMKALGVRSRANPKMMP
jgi:hypothetical protein